MGVNSVPEPPDHASARATALELLKQFVALSSGVLALSAAFVEKFWSDDVFLQTMLGVSWLLLISSVICGLQAISSMVQTLRLPDFSWSEDATRRFAAASKWTFVAGLSLFATFAFLAARRASSQKPDAVCRWIVAAEAVGVR